MSERPCRNCREGDATGSASRGVYANLCPDCIAATRPTHSARTRAAVQRDHRRDVDETGAETFEAKARTLVSHGRSLDRAIRDVRQIEMDRAEKRRLLREAAEGWKAACLRLAGAAE